VTVVLAGAITANGRALQQTGAPPAGVQQGGVQPGGVQGPVTRGTPPGTPIVLPIGTGTLSGVVIDGATNEMLDDVVVYLAVDGRGTVGPQSRQITDAKGRFAFTDVPVSDRFSLTATKFGYFSTGYGRGESPMDSTAVIALADGQWIGDLKLTMQRPGAISGTVMDERGEPVAGVLVRALSQIRLAGREQLATGPTVVTDDRGIYRIGGLGPGRYTAMVPSVQASAVASTPNTMVAPGGPPDAGLDLDPEFRVLIGKYPVPPPPAGGRSFAYPITFHPSATAAGQAVFVELAFGQERTGVDVTIAPAPAGRLTGTVTGPAEVIGSLSIRLLAPGLEELGMGTEAATALTTGDGRFVFLNVPAGAYTLDVPMVMSEFGTFTSSLSDARMPFPPGTRGSGSTGFDLPGGPPGSSFTVRTTKSGEAAAWFGRAAATVSERTDGAVTLPLKRSIAISGHVTVELSPQSGRTPPTFNAIRADPANGSAVLGIVTNRLSPSESPNEFLIEQLMPGEYFLRYPPVNGIVVKSIVADGHDYTDTPFDTSTGQGFSNVVITMTDKASTVSGTVRDRANGIAVDAAVVIFPADRKLWTNYGLMPARIRATEVSANGGFRFENLQAGDYVVVAVAARHRQVWQEPDFFKNAEGLATRVTLGWSDTKTIDLIVSVIK
jgi:hypothetical protein